jgi:hypothetical protein
MGIYYYTDFSAFAGNNYGHENPIRLCVMLISSVPKFREAVGLSSYKVDIAI